MVRCKENTWIFPVNICTNVVRIIQSFVEPQSAVKAVRKYCSAVFYINELFGEHCTLSVEDRNEKKETKMRESGPTD